MWHPEMWFTILSPLFYQFISPPSTSFGVCLRLGHPRIPQQCTFPFASPSLQSLFHICISLFPFLWCIFLYLLWLFLILFDPCVKSVLGRASRSPCCYDRGLAAEWRWPLNSQALTLLFYSFSASALSLHTASLLFISEHQFQQGSTAERTWKGLEWIGNMC